jgi:hypothetical protein
VNLEHRDSEGNKSVTLDGVVSVKYPQIADQTCTSGTFRYRTLQPLLDGTTNSGPGVFPQFSQGKLRINDSASATFLRKQEVEISVGSNSPVSYQSDSAASSALETALNCFVEF